MMKKLIYILMTFAALGAGAQVQIGDDINGIAADDRFAYNTRINHDGTIVFAAAPYDVVGTTGYVRVYEYDEIGDDWDFQTGVNAGTMNIAELGLGSDMNYTGNYIIYTYQDVGGGFEVDHDNGTTWVYRGEGYPPGITTGKWGTSAAISDNGRRVIIGSDNGGSAYIYQRKLKQ